MERQTLDTMLANLRSLTKAAKADRGQTWADMAERIRTKAEADPTRLAGEPSLPDPDPDRQ